MVDALPAENLQNVLLELLREHGGSLGNGMAQTLLAQRVPGCSAEYYKITKEALLDAGQITKGRGQGGAIRLKEYGELSSTSSNDTEQETFSASPQPRAADLELRNNLRNKLEEFGSQAENKRKHCRSERQTQRLLVEPYLEILNIDTQDPERLAVEFQTGIGKGIERVDYAVLEAGNPIWLIEVKSAQTELPNQISPQLQRYVVDTRAPFASLTNGMHWHWYMWNDNRGLEDTPFLRSDVRHPGELELDWLDTVRRGLHGPDAEHKARACKMAGRLADWLRGVAQAPSTDLLRLALRECGFSANNAEVELASTALPKAWAQHRVDAQPPTDPDGGVHLPAPAGESAAMPHALGTVPSPGTDIRNHEPGEPTGRENKRNARYRVGKSQDWIKCKDATRLMLDIIEYCAGEHRDGIDDYYKKLSIVLISGRSFLVEDVSVKWNGLPPEEKKLYAKESINGWRMFMNLPNQKKPEIIDKILATCIKRDGTHPVRGQDVWVDMPNAS